MLFSGSAFRTSQSNFWKVTHYLKSENGNCNCNGAFPAYSAIRCKHILILVERWHFNTLFCCSATAWVTASHLKQNKTQPEILLIPSIKAIAIFISSCHFDLASAVYLLLSPNVDLFSLLHQVTLWYSSRPHPKSNTNKLVASLLTRITSNLILKTLRWRWGFSIHADFQDLKHD